MISLSYLTRDNPRLLELEQAYAALDLPFGHSLWEAHQTHVGLDHFRSDGNYLGQGTLDDNAYRVMFDYVTRNDPRGYLHWMRETKDFGALTYEFKSKGWLYTVSRDLLDSIMEIYFLHDVLGPDWMLSQKAERPVHLLDIGAGYGRLAHRLREIFAYLNITCVDAVAVSTFLCEFYSQYRFPGSGWRTLGLHELNQIHVGEIDIACNVHSWSECTSAAINFWLDRLVAWEVPNLFVVPHDERWVCVEEDGTIGEFRSLIEIHGYQEVYTRPKYADGSPGLYPEVHYHLFKRGG
jgi:hypothetical protein